MPGETFTMDDAQSGGGLHVLDLAALKKIVQYALGKTTLDNSASLTDLVNDALAGFATLAPWQWRQKALSVSTAADQQYVELPADFAEMATEIHVSDQTQLGDLVKSDLDEIARLRASTLSGIAASMRYAITYVPSEEDDETPTARLELWPTPNGVMALSGVYRRVIRKLVDESDVPDVPQQFHQLLRRYVRAHALEEDDQVDAAERAWKKFNDLMPAALSADGRLDANLGKIKGAVSQADLVRWVPNITLGE